MPDSKAPLNPAQAAAWERRARNVEAPKSQAKPAKKGKSSMPNASEASAKAAPKAVAPTDERMAKEDKPVVMGDGRYRAPAPIERLYDRHSLDHNAGMNDAMYLQALELQRLHRASGLGGISAQDLGRVIGGGGDPAHMMPTTEKAAIARRELIRRCNLMGWFAAQPLRGAGRVTFAVVCLETALAQAGRLHCGVNETERAAAVAKDRLREGLMALVDLSRNPRRSTGNAVLGLPNVVLEASLIDGAVRKD